jgi:hypothetical protein
VRFTDLEPGTSYRYTVCVGEREVWNGRLRTADETDELRLAVFGHTAGSETDGTFPVQLLASTIADLQVDLALCTGDVTLYATPEGFARKWFGLFGEYLASRPIHVAPGNHDAGWPMLYGVDFSAFRAMFPHEYGTERGGSYSVDHKHVKLVAFSYVAQGPEAFAEELAWLGRELDASRAEFNLVFLGGAQEGYYDAELLFRTLSEHPVDLVLGGDGQGFRQEQRHGVDFFFAGTLGSSAPPYYLLEFQPYAFHVRGFDTRGQSIFRGRTFVSRRAKRTVTDVLQAAGTVEWPAPNEVECKGLEVERSRFDGLRVVLDWEHEDTELWVRWAPVFEPGLSGERTYRERKLVLEGSRREYLIRMPELDPLRLESYSLAEVRLRAGPEREAERFRLEGALVEVALFADLEHDGGRPAPPRVEHRFR